MKALALGDMEGASGITSDRLSWTRGRAGLPGQGSKDPERAGWL